jgi:hypothetical protein
MLQRFKPKQPGEGEALCSACGYPRPLEELDFALTGCCYECDEVFDRIAERTEGEDDGI